MTAAPPNQQPTEGGRRCTDEELLDGIQRALQAGDMLAAAALIRRLALQAPDAAQVILDAFGVSKRVTL